MMRQSAVRPLFLLACLLLLSGGGSGISCIIAASKESTPSFIEPARAVAEGDRFRISFTVNEASDVTVSMRKNGRIVRHLAAGRLGPNAPQPLKPGLKQVLYWDGKDDEGKTVDPAGCSVHVGLGLRPEFDRILGWRGEAICGGVAGLAVDEAGILYVLATGRKLPARA